MKLYDSRYFCWRCLYDESWKYWGYSGVVDVNLDDDDSWFIIDFDEDKDKMKKYIDLIKCYASQYRIDGKEIKIFPTDYDMTCEFRKVGKTLEERRAEPRREGHAIFLRSFDRKHKQAFAKVFLSILGNLDDLEIDKSAEDTIKQVVEVAFKEEEQEQPKEQPKAVVQKPNIHYVDQNGNRVYIFGDPNKISGKTLKEWCEWFNAGNLPKTDIEKQIWNECLLGDLLEEYDK